MGALYAVQLGIAVGILVCAIFEASKPPDAH